MSTSHLTSIHVNQEDLHTFNILSQWDFTACALSNHSLSFLSAEKMCFFLFLSHTLIKYLTHIFLCYCFRKCKSIQLWKPATKSNKDPCRVAVKTSHTDLQDQREGKDWKEKVKHEEEKGTETKLGYGGKELGKGKSFKRKRQSRKTPSLCGSRLKNVKIKMKFKVKQKVTSLNYFVSSKDKSTIWLQNQLSLWWHFYLNQSTLIRYLCLICCYICSPDPQTFISCVWKACLIFNLHKKSLEYIFCCSLLKYSMYNIIFPHLYVFVIWNQATQISWKCCINNVNPSEINSSSLILYFEPNMFLLCSF